ncbi:MAG: hypothetical protein GF364_03305 [Candidatus Lokiarchaeota archaeon]|nr:hypothetical protein [Candidatus Lokiarchaeota archaeon]
MRKFTLRSFKNRCKKQYLKHFLLITMIFNLWLLGFGAYHAKSDWALTQFVNVGITGWMDEDYNYFSTEDTIHKTATTKIQIRPQEKYDMPYPVTLVLTQARSLGDAAVVPDSSGDYWRPFTDSEGNEKYFQWYEQEYQFDFMAYTEATPQELMPLVTSETKKAQWLNYWYNDAWWPRSVGKIKEKGWGELHCTAEYNGMIYPGDLAKISENRRLQMGAEITLALGDVAIFPAEREITDQGTFLFEGTSYYIDQVTMLGEDTELSCTQSGIVNKNIVDNPGIAETESSTAYPQELDDAERIANDDPNNEMPMPEISKVAEGTLMDFDAGFGYITEDLSTGGRLQTVLSYDQGVSLETEDDLPARTNFSPDTAILPFPNTKCNFMLDMDMTPVLNYRTAKLYYQKFESVVVRKHHVSGGGREDKVDECINYRVSEMQKYITRREVRNIYYIQSFNVKVCFASIYDWEPEEQYSDPPEPPEEDEILEALPPPNVGGETHVDVYHPDSPSLFEIIMGLMFGWIPWEIIALIAVALVVVCIILFFMNRKAKKTLKDPVKLGAQMQQQYAANPMYGPQHTMQGQTMYPQTQMIPQGIPQQMNMPQPQVAPIAPPPPDKKPKNVVVNMVDVDDSVQKDIRGIIGLIVGICTLTVAIMLLL